MLLHEYCIAANRVNEQRQEQRKVFKTRAALVVGGAKWQARTLDICSSGMCVAVSDPLKAGTTAEVAFDLFHDGKITPIQARTKVSYCILSNGEFKVGMQFVSLDLGAMTTLAKFLR
jgi:hypothetical protein